MGAAKYNFVIEQGATFCPVITWKDSAGTAVNLTGYTARMQIRPSIDSTTKTVELTTSNGGITLGGSAGTISLLIGAASTDDLTINYRGVYDLELISASGVVTRILSGSISVSGEVTR